MSTIFIDYFDPKKFIHLQWYAYHRRNGYWPEEMFDLLRRNGVEYPTPMDPISVAVKIADDTVGIVEE